MGALIYEPINGPDSDPVLVELSRLADNAQQVFAGSSDEVLPELFRAGGSPGGARPKALIAVKGDKIVIADGEVPQGFTSWLVKFSAKGDFPDTGNIEYAYSLMAKDAGLEMPETELMEGQHFAVQRFDRVDNCRLHTHTFGNMVGADFRLASLDYEDLFRVVLDVTKSRQELVKALRQMIFNIATHNRDDHSKNFSFFWSQSEQGWRLTPAYDLMFSNGIQGEHTMTVAGEGKQPDRDHVMRLAKRFSIEVEAELFLGQIGAVVGRWDDYAEQAQVSLSSRALSDYFPVL
jgi:serine/threonine-protein kinase HipA